MSHTSFWISLGRALGVVGAACPPAGGGRKSRRRRRSAGLPQARPRPSRRTGTARGRDRSPSRVRGKDRALTVYHGTPTFEAAQSISRDGWVVGTGNAHGDGVYLSSDRSVAASYAGASGYIVRVRLDPGKTATWNTRLHSDFTAWCRRQNCSTDASARTAFLLSRGYRTLRQDNVYVVLLRGYRNPAATKFQLKRLRVVSVERRSDGRLVKV